jgi:hypothetical protein
MKPIFLTFLWMFPVVLLLSSCGITVNPDGSKTVTVDPVALQAALEAYNTKHATK